MRIHHIALESDWLAAREAGRYEVSTLGRTLADEGFIHASRPDQVRSVTTRFYGGTRKPLVRLDIDTDRLTADWREEAVGADTFPHIYGPLNLDAVIGVTPWDRSGRPKSFLEVLVGEVFFRIAVLIGVMVCSFAGFWAGHRWDAANGGWIGSLAGLGLGAVLAVLVMRRRR